LVPGYALLAASVVVLVLTLLTVWTTSLGLGRGSGDGAVNASRLPEIEQRLARVEEVLRTVEKQTAARLEVTPQMLERLSRDAEEIKETSSGLREALATVATNDSARTRQLTLISRRLDDLSRKLWGVEARAIVAKYAVQRPLGIAAVKTDQGVRVFEEGEESEFLQEAEKEIEHVQRSGGGGGGSVRDATMDPMGASCSGPPRNCIAFGWAWPSGQSLKINAVFPDDELAAADWFQHLDYSQIARSMGEENLTLCAAVSAFYDFARGVTSPAVDG
jgi:hypothetical protein